MVSLILPSRAAAAPPERVGLARPGRGVRLAVVFAPRYAR